MAADLAAARRAGEVDAAEEQAADPPARADRAAAAAGRAPRWRRRSRRATAYVGVMLPYTPLHHLLAAQLGAPIVLTSGNVSDEPIAYRDDDAARGWPASPTRS